MMEPTAITISPYLELARGNSGQTKTGVGVIYPRPAIGEKESANSDEKFPPKDV